jgi:alanyl-tRNA synthetase
LTVSEEEFKISFFAENDFVRKKCSICGEFFWTQDLDRENCGDSPCQEYGFIGKPPTKKKYSMGEMREAFLSFFEKNGHTRIQPYPVVARWRDDIYVTIASIADFQPFVTSGVIPPPANPLVVSQPCLRFNDIDNVGLTAGRHLTIFEMGGHHAFNYPDKQIYWKDQTVRFHHQFITEELGVKSELVTYKEGLWSGGGNAGPDLEGIVKGLEVCTLVFMQYKVVDDRLIDMPLKIVDTGYGIERYTWLSQGTPSAFHASYGDLLGQIIRIARLDEIDEKLLVESANLSALMKIETASDRMALRRKVAERLGADPSELDQAMVPVESIYAVADHTKALTFMLSEGVVPSNVKAGYLTRLLIRRTYRLLRILGIEKELSKIVEMQIDYWSKDYPHIKEMRKEIIEAISVEEEKYQNTLKRGTALSKRIASELKAKGASTIASDVLVELYDSHGLPPEVVKETVEKFGVKVSIPDNFYRMIALRHASAPPPEEAEIFHKLSERVAAFPETVTLYYEDPYQRSFEGKVLQVLDGKYVVLDRTLFYPEGGGQPADNGELRFRTGSVKVVDAQKVRNVIVHVIEGKAPRTGETVTGEIDWNRRISLMRHHAATHIITGAARRVVGEHAWQAGAQKGVDRSRLDVSHWLRFTHEQVKEIETLANSVVMSNLPIKVSWMPREEAEKQYGFRLYQGGVVPGREIRVVMVGDWDVEACGGLYCRTTGEIGLIKIVHTERVQDGVERIIFSAGPPAVNLIQERDTSLEKAATLMNVPIEKVVAATETMVTELKEARRKVDSLAESLAGYEAEKLLKAAVKIKNVKFVAKIIHEVDVDFMIKIGNILSSKVPAIVAVMCAVNKSVQIVTIAGKEAVKKGANAGKISAEAARKLGGGGSGGPSFGQGGGTKLDRAQEALKAAEASVRMQVGG